MLPNDRAMVIKKAGRRDMGRNGEVCRLVIK
jgi:hypothetical protein